MSFLRFWNKNVSNNIIREYKWKDTIFPIGSFVLLYSYVNYKCNCRSIVPTSNHTSKSYYIPSEIYEQRNWNDLDQDYRDHY